MKRTWTIIGVGDVPGSLKWYQALFGQPAILPAHDYFGQILDSDGTVLLCLHEWGAHEHHSLMSPDHGTPGVDDFDPALQKARSLVHSARRGATCESEHSNQGVLAPRSGRILRYDQCALHGAAPARPRCPRGAALAGLLGVPPRRSGPSATEAAEARAEVDTVITHPDGSMVQGLFEYGLSEFENADPLRQ